MSEYILEMKGITKEFPGVKALDDVSLRVRPGSVHALMGENGAGKSTLMKCLFGIYHPDAGQIVVDGVEKHFRNSKEAIDQGIAMIHQELHPILQRSVAENIFVGRLPRIGITPIVDQKKMMERAQEVFTTLGIDIDPKAKAADLSASKNQLVEICKAVSCQAKIIIMDEPTSSLTDDEVDRLFHIINDLRTQGVAIIYISHKMEEILKISDDVTIMRDGKYVGTWEAAELTTDLIISRMVGRDITERFPVRAARPQAAVQLEVRDLCSPDPRSFQNVSFELRKGEILGLGGLVGAQRTEVVEAIFGLRPIASGDIRINGKPVQIKNSRDAIQDRIALLTEERRATGIFPLLSVMDNVTVVNIRSYRKPPLGLVSDQKRKKDAVEAIQALKVKTPSPSTPIKDLSGGNQQKVLISRWLLTDPDILILDEPTRGIDVGAKYEIYTIMNELVSQGKSIMMISSEMVELLGMSDRVAVMCEGKMTGILNAKETNQEEVMHYATKFMH